MTLSLAFEDASLFSPVVQLLLNELDAESAMPSSLLDDFQLGEYQLLIARHNGDAIGCILYRLTSLNELDIRCLYVRASYREQGVGKMLFKQLTEQVQHKVEQVIVIKSEHPLVQNMITAFGLRSESIPATYPPYVKSCLVSPAQDRHLHIS
ncbi:GNAT family N-acetyltransferase [Motilimonas sp. KMU-193]|uniref:GNAT family N-acetyltransferase n=1 Tax=Motilimonas sp. KMU-193 TaxID=3388668 RepID=UPI00396B34C7